MARTSTAEVGLIGGTGLYAMEGLEQASSVEVDTPFGKPSDPLLLGRLHGRRVAFLARHGRGHRLLPTEIPYRANVYALKALGVTQVLAVGAVGSLREDVPPRSVVVPDQVIDVTRHRPTTFFGDGVVAHVSLADPFCPRLRETLVAAAATTGAPAVPKGTYLGMEGPQFSTRAESHRHRAWGCDVVGMTNQTEARLAREAEMCYATLALVTDYDAWRPHGEAVETREILALLKEMGDRAARTLSRAVATLPGGDCACRHALATALVVHPSAIPAPARERLSAILAPYLP
jgi:5'-methylthioadenosine phosphorylase